MRKGLFVTATSTGTGKTVCAALFCRILARAGYKTAYYKPVQSGAVERDGSRFAPDCLFVHACMQRYGKFTAHCSYLLKKAASPHYAARLENIRISMKKIEEDYRELAANHDYVIVEGAGGLYVPLDDELALVADIPRSLGLNTVLIAQAGLGTINHTALSWAFAFSGGIRITAIILLSYSDKPQDIEKENVHTLRKITSLDRIYLIPAIRGVNVDAIEPGCIEENIPNLANQWDIGGWIDA